MNDQPATVSAEVAAGLKQVVLADESRKHHPYSPSTLNSREWCPCFSSRQEDKPHHRAIAGTRAHGVVETGEDDQRITDEDAAAAAECLDFIDRHRRLMTEEAERLRETIRINGGDARPELFAIQELKEAYLPVDDEDTTAGYVDRVLLSPALAYAVMFDWKFGFWPVEEAKNNLQGIAYALGLLYLYPWLRHVVFYFKQPHLSVVSDAKFTRDQIPELLLRVKVSVARAKEALRRATEMNDWSMAKPAVPVCNFCGNLGRCEKVCAFACKVGHKFMPLEMPEDITPSLVHDPKQTALGLRLASVLKVWCDAFRRQLTERILRGDAPLPPGQKIQEMQKRELIDVAKFKTVALKYLTDAEYQGALEPTFGAIETLISEHAPRGQKKAAVEEFQAALLESGAVKKGDKFSFLRAVAVK